MADAVVGEEQDYHQTWAFNVEIDGISVAWFESCTGLESEVALVEQHEGGKIEVASQRPGKVKHAPIQLKVGVTDNVELYKWWLQIADAANNKGGVKESYKKSMAIVQLDRDGSERRRWNLAKCWILKFKFGDWDANADKNNIEEMTIIYARPKLKAPGVA